MTAMPDMLFSSITEADSKLSYGNEWTIKQKVMNRFCGEDAPFLDIFDTQPSDLATQCNEETFCNNNFWKNPFLYRTVGIKLVTEQESRHQEVFERGSLEVIDDITCNSRGPHNYRDNENLIDWDAYIEPPPPHDSITVKVRFKYIGRGKPISIEDPRI